MSRDQAQQDALNAIRRLEESGITSGAEYDRLAIMAQTGAPPASGNWFTRFLGYLDRPGALVRYAIADVAGWDTNEGVEIKGGDYLDVLLGRNAGLAQRLGPELVGEDARMGGAAMMEQIGYEDREGGRWGSGFLHGLASFGAELATDPLSYMTLGGAGASKEVLLQGSRSVARTASREALDMARGAVARSGRSSGLFAERMADDIVRLLPAARHDLAEEAAMLAGRNADEIARLAAAPELFMADDALRQLGEDAWQRAALAAERQTVDRIAPRVMARDWAHSDLADLVAYHGTPAYLRGGLRISPLPMLWQKGERAVGIPFTRGVGKKISRGLLGQGSVMGAKPTRLRGLLEKGMPSWFKGAETLGTSMSKRSYLRGIIRGEIPASKMAEVESFARQAAYVLGSGPKLEALRGQYLRLVQAARHAGLGEKQVYELLESGSLRALEQMPNNPEAAIAASAAILREHGVTDEGFIQGLGDFLLSWRRTAEDTFQTAQRLGVIPTEHHMDQFVPLVQNDEATALIDELAENAVTIPMDTFGGQMLNQFVAARRMRRIAAGSLGEAGHAKERLFGASSILPLGTTGRTDALNWDMLTSLVQASPELQAHVMRTLGEDVLTATGVPTYRLISYLNEQMGEALQGVLRANPRLVEPKMASGGRFTIFSENPLVIADNYLVDMHAAIVERMVVNRLLEDPTMLEKVTPALQAEVTRFRLAQLFEGKAPDLLLQVGRRAEALEKAGAARVARAQVMRTVKAGGQSVELPAEGLTPRIEQLVRDHLTRAGDAEARRIDAAKAERAVVALTKRGVPQEMAEELARVRPMREAKRLWDDAAREAKRTLRAEVSVLLESARRGGGGDAAVREIQDWWVEQTAAVTKSLRRAERQMEQAISRQMPKPSRVALAESDVIDALAEVHASAASLQKATRLMPEGPLRGLVDEATQVAMGGDWHRGARMLDEAISMLGAAEADLPGLRAAMLDGIRAAAVGRMGPDRLDRMTDWLLRLEQAQGVEFDELWDQFMRSRTLTATQERVLEGRLRDQLLARGLPEMGVHRIEMAGAEALADLPSIRDRWHLASWAEGSQAAASGVKFTARFDPPAVERALRRLYGYGDDQAVGWQMVHMLTDTGKQVKVRTPYVLLKPAAEMSPSQIRQALQKAGIPIRRARQLLLETSKGSRLAADLTIPRQMIDGIDMPLYRGAVFDAAGNMSPVYDGRFLELATGQMGGHAAAAGRLDLPTGHDQAARLLPNASSGATEWSLVDEGGVSINGIGPAGGEAYVRMTEAQWNLMRSQRPTQFATVVDFLRRARVEYVRMDIPSGRASVTRPLADIAPEAGRVVNPLEGVLPKEAQDALLRMDDATADLADGLMEAMASRTRLERMGHFEVPAVDSVVQPGDFDEVSRADFLLMLEEARATPIGGRRVQRFTHQGEGMGTLTVREARTQLAEYRKARAAGGMTVGDMVNFPDADYQARGRFFLSADGRSGFAVADDGELFGLFNVGEARAGQSAIVRARQEGATSLVSYDMAGNVPIYERYGFVVTRRDGWDDALAQPTWRREWGTPDFVSMRIVPAELRAMRDTAARSARATSVLEQVAALTSKGGRFLDEAEVLMSKNRALLRGVDADTYDRMRRSMSATQALRDPSLHEGARALIRARQVLEDAESRAGAAWEDIESIRRGLLDTAQQVQGNPDAVRTVTLAARLVETVQRVMQSLEGLPIRQGAEAAAIREQMAEARALARRLGYTKFADGFQAVGVMIPPAGKTLTRAYALGGDVLDMTAASPWVGQFLSSLTDQVRALNTPIGLQFLGHQARTVGNMWKAMATVARPTFHVRNLIGGIWNGQIGGVGLRDYAWVRDKMLRIRRLQANGATLAEAIERLPEVDRVVFRDAFNQGVLQTSFSRSELGSVLRRRTGAARFNPLSTQGPLVKTGAVAMESIEDFLRMATFKHFHAQGADLAYEWTMALHFDYKNLTHMETAIKRVIPFFVWTRNNLPLQLRALVERPDLIQRYQHLMYGFSDQNSDPDGAYDLPFGGSNVLAIKTGTIFNADTPFWARAIISPDLPLTDLGDIEQLYNPASWAKYAFGTLGPHMSLPWELSRQEEIGGSVNAPPILNEILLGLNRLGLYDSVDADEGVARIPRAARYLTETLIPPLAEYTRPFDTDPSRRQALGLPSGDLGAPSAQQRARAYAIWLARGVGLQTQTPTQAYSQSWRAQDEIQAILNELQHRGLLAPRP